MIGFKPTERHKQIGIKWAARFALFILGWMLAIQPALMKIKLNRGATRDIEERSQLILSVHQLQEKNKHFDSALPDEENAHALLGKISKLANENHFDVQSLVPSTESAGPYTKVKLNLRGRASFTSLLSFLKAFEALKLSGAVASMSMANDLSRADMGGLPQVEMVLETYLKKA